MFSMIKQLFGMVDNKQKRGIKIYIGFSLISPFIDIFSISMIVPILNMMTKQTSASPKLILFSLGMGIVMVLKGFFELLRTRVSNSIIYDGSQSLSEKMYELFIKEDLIEHNKKTQMQALAAVRSDSTICINLIISEIAIMINIITLIAYSVALIVITKIIGLLSCSAVVIFMLVVYRFNKKQLEVYGQKRRKLDIKENALITTSLGAFKEMKIDDRSEFMIKRFDQTSKKYAKVQSQYSFRNSIISVVMQNAVQATLFFFLAVIMVLQINITEILIQLIAYSTIFIRLIPLSSSIVNGISDIEYSKNSYKVVKECCGRYEQMKKEEESKKKIREKKVTFQKGLSIRNLTFGYTENRLIFHNASIEIPAGHSIAIIGPSGAGKTTFLDLVLGLLHPQSGEIYYDDYDIVKEMDNQGVCKANIGEVVSYIPQTVFLNGETVRNNVAFFMPEGEIQEEKIIECLKCAQIWEDVKHMPDGLDTMIGENGTAISGGQRQRIALARALYKDFELLIMDEATAALDMETEKAVIDSIRQIKSDKTLLMVTHHMSLANECEIVYKIENKSIVRIR